MPNAEAQKLREDITTMEKNLRAQRSRLYRVTHRASVLAVPCSPCVACGHPGHKGRTCHDLDRWDKPCGCDNSIQRNGGYTWQHKVTP